MKYFTWPGLALSGPALDAVESALNEWLLIPREEDHVYVELQNMANEARAMLQQIAVGDRRPEEDIDPLLR